MGFPVYGAAAMPAIEAKTPTPKTPKDLEARRSFIPKDLFALTGSKKLFGSQKKKPSGLTNGSQVEDFETSGESEALRIAAVKIVKTGEQKDLAEKNVSIEENKSNLAVLSQQPSRLFSKKTPKNKISTAQNLPGTDLIHRDTFRIPTDIQDVTASSASGKKALVTTLLDSNVTAENKDSSPTHFMTVNDVSATSSYTDGHELDFAVKTRLPRDSYHQYLNKRYASAADGAPVISDEGAAQSVRSCDSEDYSFRTSDIGTINGSRHSQSIAEPAIDEKSLPSTPRSTSGYCLIPSTTNGSINSELDLSEVKPLANAKASLFDSPRSLLTARSVTITSAKLSTPNISAIPTEDDYYNLTGNTIALKTSRKILAMHPMPRIAALEVLLATDDSKNVLVSFISDEGCAPTDYFTPSKTSGIDSKMASGTLVVPPALTNWLIPFPAGEAIPEVYKAKAIDSEGTKYYACGPFISDRNSDMSRNSFVKVTIDELLQRYPELRSDLEALRTSVNVHERNVRLDGISEQLKSKDEIAEMLEVMSSRGGKEAKVAAIIERSQSKLDAADVKAERLIQEMMHLETACQGWESQFHDANRDLTSQSLIQSEKVASLEREKRALLEKNNYLEEKLDTERLRTISAERARSSAVANANNMRKQFDHYRKYFETQVNVHAQYMGSGTVGLPAVEEQKQFGRSPSTSPNSSPYASMATDSETARKLSVSYATDALRDRYRQILKDTRIQEPLNGGEFLTYVQAGNTSSSAANEVPTGPNDNTGVGDDSFVSKVTTTSPRSTPTFNFLDAHH